jgi:hypothetical protein
VASLGIDPARLQHDCEGTLYRSILVVPLRLQAGLAQRSAAFDQFCQRLARNRGDAEFVSFSSVRPPQRLYLTTGEGPALLNGAALRKAAQIRGFTVVDTDATNFATIAALMAHARIVVGVSHAMGWAGLARRCQLGVLIAEDDASPPYPVLHTAAACEHNVTIACGTSLGAGGFAVASTRFDALLDRIDKPQAATGALR